MDVIICADEFASRADCPNTHEQSNLAALWYRHYQNTFALPKAIEKYMRANNLRFAPMVILFGRPGPVGAVLPLCIDQP